MFPSEKDYSIKVVARDEGNMEYYISEADGVSQYRNVEFYDLPLRMSKFTVEAFLKNSI